MSKITNGKSRIDFYFNLTTRRNYIVKFAEILNVCSHYRGDTYHKLKLVETGYHIRFAFDNQTLLKFEYLDVNLFLMILSNIYLYIKTKKVAYLKDIVNYHMNNSFLYYSSNGEGILNNLKNMSKDNPFYLFLSFDVFGNSFKLLRFINNDLIAHKKYKLILALDDIIETNVDNYNDSSLLAHTLSSKKKLEQNELTDEAILHEYEERIRDEQEYEEALINEQNRSINKSKPIYKEGMGLLRTLKRKHEEFKQNLLNHKTSKNE